MSNYKETDLIVSFKLKSGDKTYWYVPDFLKTSNLYEILYDNSSYQGEFSVNSYGNPIINRNEDTSNIPNVDYFLVNDGGYLIENIVDIEEFIIVCKALNFWGYNGELPDMIKSYIDEKCIFVLNNIVKFKGTFIGDEIMNYIKTLKLKDGKLVYYYIAYKKMYGKIDEEFDYFTDNKSFIAYQIDEVDKTDHFLFLMIPAYVSLLEGPFINVFNTEFESESLPHYMEEYPYIKFEECNKDENNEFRVILDAAYELTHKIIKRNPTFKYKGRDIFEHFIFNLLSCGRYFGDLSKDVNMFLMLFKNAGYKLNLDILFKDINLPFDDFEVGIDIIIFVLRLFNDDISSILNEKYNWNNIPVLRKRDEYYSIENSTAADNLSFIKFDFQNSPQDYNLDLHPSEDPEDQDRMD